MFWLKLPANSVSKTLVKSKLDNYPLNSGSVTRNNLALVVLQRQLGLCVLVGKLVPFADLRFFMIEDWPWSKSGLIRPQSGWFSNYEVICKVKGAIYVGRIKHLCKTMAFTFDHHQNFEIADLDSVETLNKGLPSFWKICRIRDFFPDCYLDKLIKNVWNYYRYCCRSVYRSDSSLRPNFPTLLKYF